MNKLGALFIIGGAMVGPCLPLDALVVATSQPAVETTTTTDRYIVQFNTGTDPDREAAELSGLGVQVDEVYRSVFAGVAVHAVPDLLEQIRSDPDVRRVEPDQVISLDAVPPTVVQSPTPSWGLDRIDQRSLPLSNSYSYNAAGAGVTAYIIDSGINAAHVDFSGRLRSGLTTVLDGHGTDDWCVGHGSHVAGIVGGQTYGVAKSVSLVAVRVLDCNGETTGSQLLQGLDWVIADHQTGAAAVANISIGGPGSLMVDNAVQAVINDGVTVAIAAGNEMQNACNVSPARTAAAITVAASSEADARPTFSNFGACVDLFAPGTNITSDFIGSSTATAMESGTSMAAPHAAGAAAVVLSSHPTWTPAQVASELVAGATVNVISNVAGSPNRLLFSAPVSASSLVPVVPARLLESRSGPGVGSVDGLFQGLGVRGAGSVTELLVAGRGGVVGDASAVVLTVTVTEPGAAGFVTVFPCGAVQPLASNVNFDVGATVANSVVSGVGVGGRVCVFVSAATHLVVDVNGFFGAVSSLVPVVPARLLESRSGPGVGSVDGLFQGLGVRGAGSVTELLVAGRGGVVGDASAVVLTVTVTEPGAAGFVTVFPCGAVQPLASNVNFDVGATVANSVVSGVGVGGRVCVFVSAATHLVVDVNGFFGAVSSLVPVVPARLLESRSGPGVGSVDGLFQGLGVRGAGSVTELLVAGRGGVVGDASAVVLTVTVTEPGAAGFVTVFPCGAVQPLASNVNFDVGATVANSVVSGVGVGGRVCVFVSAATHLIVDVNGYFR